jgi:AraC-like DNA-binding protein
VADDNDKEVEMSKGDQEFISKAKKMVESNLSNSDYTTEQFASDMCMSRMNLYRKLQKITGQKPTEFVRMIRLQAAAKMLKDSSYTVSEISEKVGFTSSTYFSRCFKEAFGMVPTQYANIK